LLNIINQTNHVHEKKPIHLNIHNLTTTYFFQLQTILFLIPGILPKTMSSNIISTLLLSDSARHRSQDMFPSISQIVLKNFVKNSLINEEILIKLAIVPKISKSSWNTVIWLLSSIKTIDIFGQLKVIFDTIINALPLILFDEIIQLLSSVITPSSNYPIKLL
jgi:hypothetical protein